MNPKSRPQKHIQFKSPKGTHGGKGEQGLGEGHKPKLYNHTCRSQSYTTPTTSMGQYDILGKTNGSPDTDSKKEGAARNSGDKGNLGRVSGPNSPEVSNGEYSDKEISSEG